MLQLRGQIDNAKAHAARLERSVVHHRLQLDTIVAKIITDLTRYRPIVLELI